MEKTSAPGVQAETLDISSNTLLNTSLDDSYLDALFSADPDQVEELAEKEPGQQATPEAPPAKDPPANPPAPATGSFLVDDPDFIEGLEGKKPPVAAAGKEQSPAAEKPAPGQPAAAGTTAATAEGSAPAPASTPLLDQHISDFTRELFDTGILSLEEQEEISAITTPAALVERFLQEKQKGAVQILENILGHYGPEYRDAFNAIYVNGVHPRDYFEQAGTVETLADIDLAKPENQKFVLSKYYKSLGWDGPKIHAKIEKLENYQDLEEEARDIHATLLSKEKQTLQGIEESKKQELAQKTAIEQQYRTGVERILKEKLKTRELDGIPLDEKTVRQLAGYMLEKKWQLGDQQISDYEKDILDLTRPEHRELQVKVALLMQLLKADPTLSRLQRKAITTESNTMFSFLQREQSTAKKQGKKTVNFFDD